MLRNIVLLLTNFYLEKIIDSPMLELFKREVEKTGAEVFVYDSMLLKNECTTDLPVWGRELCVEETLYIADEQETLMKLQERGCFTIACYHEAVEGVLGFTQYAIEGLDGIEWDYLYKVYQRYCGIPWQITQTRRCKIREMGQQDLDELYELYKDERVTKYIEDLFGEKEKERQYIADYIENIYKYYGFGTWLIHRKEDGKLIGRAGFNFRPGFDEVELGFVIGCPFWRNGYAYEVCSHLLQLGKSVFEFGKIQALVDGENTASISLLKKLGFYYAEDVTVDGKDYRRYLYD